MKIKMLKTLAGGDHKRAGEEYDVEDALGEALCSDGRAVAVEEPKPKRKRNGRANASGIDAKPADVEER